MLKLKNKLPHNISLRSNDKKYNILLVIHFNYTGLQNFNFCLWQGRDYVHLIELIFLVKNTVFLDIVYVEFRSNRMHEKFEDFLLFSILRGYSTP
jgi:hypothetical protein